jgi:solute carrier family 34 (sodium-dependent phosphate cotransporter)
MDEAPTDKGPRNSSGNGGIPGGAPAAGGSVAAPPATAEGAEAIQLPVWAKVLGWCGIAGLIYLLICAVSIISRGFAGLSGDAAHSMFAFAENPWVGLSVGVLGTVLIQSSTTTHRHRRHRCRGRRAAHPRRHSHHHRREPRHHRHAHAGRAHLRRQPHRIPQGAGRLNNPRLLQLARAADLFPIELIWHPLERISGTLTNTLYGTGWLPHPAHFNFVRAATRPVENGVITATTHLSETLGPLFTVVIGALLILASVYFLGKLLKLLMVGKARDILTWAVTRNAYLAMASGMGATVLTQSSTITNSILVPFAGTGILTPAQIYPVTVGANLGTTFTTVFAAFAVDGPDAKIGLQAAFVHLVYNVFAIIVIYVIPVLRPLPHRRLHRTARRGHHPGRRALKPGHVPPG